MTTETTFYKYSQNNSGGTFLSPAIEVYIEASSPEEANDFATWFGLYFDDDCEIDCSCCGQRWYPASDWSTTYDEEAAIPMPSEDTYMFALEDKIPAIKIFRKD